MKKIIKLLKKYKIILSILTTIIIATLIAIIYIQNYIDDKMAKQECNDLDTQKKLQKLQTEDLLQISIDNLDQKLFKKIFDCYPYSLIDSKEIIEIKDKKYGSTVLMYAILWGQEKIFKDLYYLDYGNYAKKKSKEGFTALMYSNKYEISKLLLPYSDLYAKNKYGSNVLEMISGRGNGSFKFSNSEYKDKYKIIELYLNHAKVETNPYTGKEGFSIDNLSEALIRSIGAGGISWLFNSFYINEDKKIIKILIDAGANVNFLTKESYMKNASAISEASRYGKYEIVKILLNAGANVNIKNSFRQTPLILTSIPSTLYKDNKELIKSKRKVVKMLINAGAYLNEKDRYGKTALDYAKSAPYLYRDKELIKILKEAGAE